MKIPPREELYNLYIVQKWSTRKCAEHFSMSQPWLRKYMKELSIPSRPVSENGWYKKGIKFTQEHKDKISKALVKNNNMKNKFFELHHGYKNGKRSYRKYLLRGFLNAICSTCQSNKKLIVHHIDSNRDNNSLNNLKVLCASCHKKWHLAHPVSSPHIGV